MVSTAEEFLKNIFAIYLLISGAIEARRSWRYYKYQEYSLPIIWRHGISIRKYISGSSAAEQLRVQYESSSWIKLNILLWAIFAPIGGILLIFSE